MSAPTLDRWGVGGRFMRTALTQCFERVMALPLATCALEGAPRAHRGPFTRWSMCASDGRDGNDHAHDEADEEEQCAPAAATASSLHHDSLLRMGRGRLHNHDLRLRWGGRRLIRCLRRIRLWSLVLLRVRLLVWLRSRVWLLVRLRGRIGLWRLVRLEPRMRLGTTHRPPALRTGGGLGGDLTTTIGTGHQCHSRAPG